MLVNYTIINLKTEKINLKRKKHRREEREKDVVDAI